MRRSHAFPATAPNLASLLCGVATRQAASATARLLTQHRPVEPARPGNPRVGLFSEGASTPGLNPSRLPATFS